MLLFLLIFFLIIFHVVLVFVLVFIFEVFPCFSFCFFGCSSCSSSAIFKEFKILFCWVCLKFSECGTELSYCFLALIIIPRFIEFRLSGGSWYAFLCDS